MFIPIKIALCLHFHNIQDIQIASYLQSKAQLLSLETLRMARQYDCRQLSLDIRSKISRNYLFTMVEKFTKPSTRYHVNSAGKTKANVQRSQRKVYREDFHQNLRLSLTCRFLSIVDLKKSKQKILFEKTRTFDKTWPQRNQKIEIWHICIAQIT